MLPSGNFVATSACTSIILILKPYKPIIVSTLKINLKAFWREILIAILIALLIWVSSSQKVVTLGSSDTICHTDTISHSVLGAKVIRYQKVRLWHIDTVQVVTMDSVESVRIDTAWLYTDVPVQEYVDTAYYVRTLGWLDSISIYRPTCEPTKGETMTPFNFGVYGSMQLGSGVAAPGIDLTLKRWIVGYHYNVINSSGQVTVGYRLY